MKLFLIIGIFLGSVLTASAQFADGETYERLCGSAAIAANGGTLPFICTNAMGSAGGSTGSGNNSGSNGSAPCFPSSQSANIRTQSGWATTEQINKELANGTLKPKDVSRRWGSEPTTNSNPAPATTGNLISQGWNLFTSTIFGIRAPSQKELELIQKRNDAACRGIGINNPIPQGCPCNAPNVYDMRRGECMRVVN